jgi:hypothetical protein
VQDEASPRIIPIRPLYIAAAERAREPLSPLSLFPTSPRLDSPLRLTVAMMLRSRHAARAFKAVAQKPSARSFTSSPAVAAVQSATKTPAGTRSQTTSATSPAP